MGTHEITVTPSTPLGTAVTGDALLIFNLVVIPRCDGAYLTVVKSTGFGETDINWTLGTAAGDLALNAFTVTPSVCVIKYEIISPSSLDALVTVDNVNGDLDM